MWRYGYLLAFSLLFCSCFSSKKVNYILDNEFSHENVTAIPNNRVSYEVQPNDILSIRLQSLDPTQSAFFNIEGEGRALQANQASLYLSSYSVDEKGLINSPIVGQLKVNNMTVDEVQNLIQVEISKYLIDAIVLVKLVSFKITVLGDVRRAGTYYIYNNQATIFEVLGLAGDLTTTASRKNVKLIRQIEDSSYVILLDLTDPKIIESPYYFMLPNDVIYVEIARAQTARTNLPLLGTLFAAISTTILLLNFINDD